MAQRTQTILIDDVDGGEGTETVTFALDGVTYEIDLSKSNASALRDAMAPWVGHGRRVTGRASVAARSGGRKASSSGNDSAAVRRWARSNGHTVSERGRISGAVMDAYAAAH